LTGRQGIELIKKPIRVVRIIDRLNIGGPAKHVTWLSAGLKADEFQTTLVTGVVPPGEGDMSYFAREAGIEPVVITEMSRELGLRDLLVIARLLKLFFALKPQIIHTHKAKAGAAGRVAAMFYKWLTPSALWLRPRPCKIVHTFHGHIFHSYYGALKTRIFVLIESLLGRFCTDTIITISRQQRREIAGILGLQPGGKFQVIPLGIDFAESAAPHRGLRQEYAVADEELLIGIVGRLCEVKDQALFLRAAAHLAGSRARFVIIGDGHLRQQLMAQAEQSGIADRVIFTGFRKDVAALYAELDIVALTSLNEGTPLTLIEAMSSGRPVCATEVGGVVDLMGERSAATEDYSIWQNGLTVVSRDAERFARALQFLINEAELRRQMGLRGQTFVRAQLSKARLLGDIENLYRRLLGGASPSRQKVEMSLEA
jgi:glycosyltransferase involved in cell wall biosynthesis